ncbi:TetR family transcriptional regulator [Streptomyces triticiradicis]|uniref:TetR/AcrR family transcriptional regulator n=1 Tax=Streptomyces triticiradicis TaxID=2651189 RepID=A0A7J5DJ72_9ACTN|nr:TetR family transcriptional regulator [Streptomyces triticiradicis]KAB1988712.1 TetR/AcrR family transcriptional regulator [Streptomyces triticiradicis]
MTRDPGLTKERLLAAATEEFAAHGIAGARVDRIAASAGVNKERIYGYFGNKQKLFDAVVGRALDEVAEAVPLHSGDDPAEYVGRVYDFHRDNPVLVRLLLWEGLHYSNEVLPGEDSRRGHYEDKIAALAGTLGFSQALGEEASAEVAPVLLTLIGLAVWPHAVPQMARLILDPAAPGTDLREHVVEFARRAVAARAEV